MHQKYRNSVVIFFIWKSIAEYLKKTKARFLFGCSSITTLNPYNAFILYQYLKEKNYLKPNSYIFPKTDFHSQELEDIINEQEGALKSSEVESAKYLLPSLMKSYFDMGSYTPCLPAFDRDLNCIDFLTILDVENLNARMARKTNFTR